jgi:copper(I)-binding protein
MKFALLIPAVFALALSAAQAHEYKLGSLEIDHPWTRATPKGAKVAGGYVKISNKGTVADRLTAAKFAIAPRVEIHEMAMSGGMMKMRQLKAGLEIKPGETVELKPGGYHIMFMNWTKPLERGQRIKGTLIFEKAGSIDVEFDVETMGTSTPAHGKGGH